MNQGLASSPVADMAQSAAMRAATLWTTDDRLLARLQAPPDLTDGVESLGYWRERRRRLPWYRMRARREATLMTLRWEQRVSAAVLTEHGTPVAVRLSAGLLVARTRFRRWTTRLVVTATIMVALMTGLTLAAAAFVVHTL